MLRAQRASILSRGHPRQLSLTRSLERKQNNSLANSILTSTILYSCPVHPTNRERSQATVGLRQGTPADRFLHKGQGKQNQTPYRYRTSLCLLVCLCPLGTNLSADCPNQSPCFSRLSSSSVPLLILVVRVGGGNNKIRLMLVLFAHCKRENKMRASPKSHPTNYLEGQ